MAQHNGPLKRRTDGQGVEEQLGRSTLKREECDLGRKHGRTTHSEPRMCGVVAFVLIPIKRVLVLTNRKPLAVR